MKTNLNKTQILDMIESRITTKHIKYGNKPYWQRLSAIKIYATLFTEEEKTKINNITWEEFLKL